MALARGIILPRRTYTAAKRLRFMRSAAFPRERSWSMTLLVDVTLRLQPGTQPLVCNIALWKYASVCLEINNVTVPRINARGFVQTGEVNRQMIN